MLYKYRVLSPSVLSIIIEYTYFLYTLQVEEPPPADKEAGKKQEGEQANGPKLDEEQQQQQSPNNPSEPMDVD